MPIDPLDPPPTAKQNDGNPKIHMYLKHSKMIARPQRADGGYLSLPLPRAQLHAKRRPECPSLAVTPT